MRVRGRLQALVGKRKSLPATIVENCGSVHSIAKYNLDMRSGKTSGPRSDGELQLMWDLVDEYSKFKEHVSPQKNRHAPTVGECREVVVLTGATGALGAHVLDLCAKDRQIRKIVCLIRGEDEHAARRRLDKALIGPKLSPIKASENEIVVFPAKLGDPKLGLDEETYAKLAREATVIVHLAWEVKFRLNLRSLRNNSIAGKGSPPLRAVFADLFVGVTNLINLALSSPRSHTPYVAYCSSVASVMNQQGNIPEEISTDPKDASPLGYSRSKWVAEQICKRGEEQTGLQGRVLVFRVGQLAGDSNTGVWNEKEAWPMMLSTVKLTKLLPEIKDEPLNWLPVDIAAQAFVEAAIERMRVAEGIEVVHVLNQHRQPT
jgi:thioester reductase-like protein